jgi:hypothetical protein
MPDPIVITQAGPVILLDVPAEPHPASAIACPDSRLSAYSVHDLIRLRDVVADALPDLIRLAKNANFVRFHTMDEHAGLFEQVDQSLATLDEMLRRLDVLPSV